MCKVKVRSDTIIEIMPSNRRNNYKNIYFYADVTILIILYILQGFPIGLSDIFPSIIQTLGASYKDLARFSITSWPFSLKILWAPIVDAAYCRLIGRRKTWVIFTQLSIGFILIFLSTKIDSFLTNVMIKSYLYQLIFIFTLLTFLAATQDIAVDGWGLNMLPRSHISYASFCNTVGQTIGYIAGNCLFLLFTSPIGFLSKITDSYLISESNFIFYTGVGFIIITLSVLVLKRENLSVSGKNDPDTGIMNSYRELYNYMTRPHVIKITLIILTLKFCFVATDSLINPKLIEFGMTKEDFALLSIPAIIVQISVSIIASNAIRDRNPVKLLLKVFPFKIFLVFLSIGFIKVEQYYKNNRVVFLSLAVCFCILHNIIQYFHYAALMAFFSLIINPRYAGSQLTYLNTINNLAYKWPHTLFLYFFDNLTIRSCGNSINIDKNTKCPVLIDGYHVVAMICIVSGIMWYRMFKNEFLNLSIEAIKTVDKFINLKED